MKASYYLWFWLGAEILFFILFSRWLGWGITLLLLTLGSYFGWRYLRAQLQALGRKALRLNANANGFAVVGGFLLFLPGLFNSLLALCFIVPSLQKTIAPKLWAWIRPERIYEHYSEQVQAHTSDGQKVEAELLPPKKSKNKKRR